MEAYASGIARFQIILCCYGDKKIMIQVKNSMFLYTNGRYIKDSENIHALTIRQCLETMQKHTLIYHVIFFKSAL